MVEYNGIKEFWKLLLIQTVILFGTTIVLMTVGAGLGLTDYEKQAIISPLMIISIIIGVSYFKRFNKNIPNRVILGINGFNPTFLLLLTVFPFSTMCFGNMVTMPITEIMTKLFGVVKTPATPDNINMFLFMICVSCVAVPIIEELFFRGVLLSLLKPYGTIFAVIVSALGFTLMHYSPQLLITGFIVGIVLAFIRVYSGSIFPCMIFHSFLNLISILQLVFAEELALVQNGFNILSICFAILCPVLFAVMYFVYGRKKTHGATVARSKGGAVYAILIALIYIIMSVSAYMEANAPKVENTNVPQIEDGMNN